MVKVDKQPIASAMAEAWRQFEAGDKLSARRSARQVLAGQSSMEEKAQASELLKRLGIPKVAYALAGAAAGVALILVLLARHFLS